MEIATSTSDAQRRITSLPKVRIANNGDGDSIAALLQHVGWDVHGVDVDWNDIYPYWLVAEQDGVFIGCIQSLPSKPIGRLEFLAVRTDLSHQMQALAVKALLIGGMATLRAAGATLVAGTVPHDLKSYKRILKNRGGMVIGTGSVIVKRLV